MKKDAQRNAVLNPELKNGPDAFKSVLVRWGTEVPGEMMGETLVRQVNAPKKEELLIAFSAKELAACGLADPTAFDVALRQTLESLGVKRKDFTVRLGPGANAESAPKKSRGIFGWLMGGSGPMGEQQRFSARLGDPANTPAQGAQQAPLAQIEILWDSSRKAPAVAQSTAPDARWAGRSLTDLCSLVSERLNRKAEREVASPLPAPLASGLSGSGATRAWMDAKELRALSKMSSIGAAIGTPASENAEKPTTKGRRL